MSAPVALPLPRAPADRTRRGATAGARGGAKALGTAALGVAVGLSVALVLVAAERPSFLSGPARHGYPSWMVGPFAHLVPALPDSPPRFRPTSRGCWSCSALPGWSRRSSPTACRRRSSGRRWSPRRAVAFVGLNSLVLVYGIGGAHNEPLVLLCATAAVALAVVGRDELAGPWWDVGAGACAVLAAGFKPSAALLAPIVVLGCRRRLRAREAPARSCSP